MSLGYGNSRICLLIWMLASSTLLGQHWPDEFRRGPVTYHADFPLAPIEPLLESIAELQDGIPELLHLEPMREPVHVFLFREPETYRRYLQQHFPTAPLRPALFVKQRGPGMVFAHRGRNFEMDLRHETTHAVLHAILPMVPLWLDEGFGEYFEVPSTARFGNHPHLKSIRAITRWRRVPSLDKLEQCEDLSNMGNDDYRDAWSWVHFMLHGPPSAREALRAYLHDLQAQTPPGLLSERLRRQVPDLPAAYLAHFRQDFSDETTP